MLEREQQALIKQLLHSAAIPPCQPFSTLPHTPGQPPPPVRTDPQLAQTLDLHRLTHATEKIRTLHQLMAGNTHTTVPIHALALQLHLMQCQAMPGLAALAQNVPPPTLPATNFINAARPSMLPLPLPAPLAPFGPLPVVPQNLPLLTGPWASFGMSSSLRSQLPLPGQLPSSAVLPLPAAPSLPHLLNAGLTASQQASIAAALANSNQQKLAAALANHPLLAALVTSQIAIPQNRPVPSPQPPPGWAGHPQDYLESPARVRQKDKPAFPTFASLPWDSVSDAQPWQTPRSSAVHGTSFGRVPKQARMPSPGLPMPHVKGVRKARSRRASWAKLPEVLKHCMSPAGSPSCEHSHQQASLLYELCGSAGDHRRASATCSPGKPRSRKGSKPRRAPLDGCLLSSASMRLQQGCEDGCHALALAAAVLDSQQHLQNGHSEAGTSVLVPGDQQLPGLMPNADTWQSQVRQHRMQECKIEADSGQPWLEVQQQLQQVVCCEEAEGAAPAAAVSKASAGADGDAKGDTQPVIGPLSDNVAGTRTGNMTDDHPGSVTSTVSNPRGDGPGHKKLVAATGAPWFTLDDLRRYFHMPEHDAHKALANDLAQHRRGRCGLSTFKKRVGQIWGVRWPYRKVKAALNMLATALNDWAHNPTNQQVLHMHAAVHAVCEQYRLQTPQQVPAEFVAFHQLLALVPPSPA